MFFTDRKEAGIKLAEALACYKEQDVVVFALPRGGVVLGAEIARKLSAPLDIVIAKKIGHPMNPEYAICAVVEEGEPICNESEVRKIDPTWFENEVAKVRSEIKRRREEYFGSLQQQNIEEKVALIVDDGIATGFTMIAAIRELKRRNPKKIVAAIPVTPYDTAQTLKSLADEVVSLSVDKNYLGAVGAYYGDFTQVDDGEVISLLKSFQ